MDSNVLLAGPILRRSDQEKVCVWIATSKNVKINLEIFTVRDLQNTQTNKKPDAIGYGTAESFKLGDKLFINLVIAAPKRNETKNVGNKFPTDELLAYDIELFVDGDSEKGKRLKDLGLLSGENSILYETKSNIYLPTFFLRGKRYPLNFLHGSCRKLHGDGEDCFLAADKTLSENLDNLHTRPSVLFLTGDQIYADDVAAPLSRHLNELGNSLIGGNEEIPQIGDISKIPLGTRYELVKEKAKFGPKESADFHLLGFREFVAMYLVAWSNENWPKYYGNALQKVSDWYEQVIALEKSRKIMPNVRRVLANIPTYMIFDDHEITDDWNLEGKWYDDVKNSDCGRRIVTNGLVAYWAFQGWGNDPDTFDDEFKSKVTNYLEKLQQTNADSGDLENWFWTFSKWTFSAPTEPLTIFLDCRTQRKFESKSDPPWLLSEDGLQTTKNALDQANYKTYDPIMIVSQSPVFGFEYIESVKDLLGKLSNNHYFWDMETWSANKKGFLAFMKFLTTVIKPKYCVILSGDVHYGFSVKAKFTLSPLNKDGSGGYSFDFIQLTSSAIKNTGAVNMISSIIFGLYAKIFSNSINVGWYQCPDTEIMNILIKNNNNDPNSLQGKIKKIIGEPFTISMNDYEEKQIKRIPDWIDSRTYISTHGITGWPIIADNNIGLVNLDYGSIINHNLLTVKGQNVQNNETSVNILFP